MQPTSLNPTVRPMLPRKICVLLTLVAVFALPVLGRCADPAKVPNVITGGSTSARPGNTAGVPANYRLVWSDEFDKDGLPDATKWAYDTERNAAGWYNNEQQYYAARRLQNSRVKGGKLIITARKEKLTTAPDYGGQSYSSVRLITRGKASWTYGFFEVRAKLPGGVGTWPAIWMLGATGNWPDAGEIDIMEQVGKNPTLIYGTIHTKATLGTDGDGGHIAVADDCDRFHNYQLTWTPDSLSIGMDGKIFHTYKNPGKGNDSWPFDKPQYLLLNVALGGGMAGKVIDDKALPRQMEVEYVRVYQKR